MRQGGVKRIGMKRGTRVRSRETSGDTQEKAKLSLAFTRGFLRG